MERSEGREKAIVNRLKASPDEIGLFAAFVEKKEERKRKIVVARTWGSETFFPACARQGSNAETSNSLHGSVSSYPK